MQRFSVNKPFRNLTHFRHNFTVSYSHKQGGQPFYIDFFILFQLPPFFWQPQGCFFLITCGCKISDLPIRMTMPSLLVSTANTMVCFCIASPFLNFSLIEHIYFFRYNLYMLFDYMYRTSL